MGQRITGYELCRNIRMVSEEGRLKVEYLLEM